MAQEDEARDRHPAGQWRSDITRMARAVAERLRAEGHPFPEFAASVLAERGRLGMDRATFAAHLGLDEGTIAAAEDGSLAPTDAPASLTDLSRF
jgi:ribosome-binding protein aMBF1 (putative translation factor)